MSSREVMEILGACFLIIAVFQLVTGSLSVHISKAKPSITMSARGTRLFAVGLASSGVLMVLVGWSPTQLQGTAAWIAVIGLIAVTFGCWWGAVQMWKRDNQTPKQVP
jgi:phosphatidylglycerophosphate synthase